MDRRRFFFRTKQIWFSDSIYDIKGYSRIVFSGCGNKYDETDFIRKEYVTSIIDLTHDLHDIWKKMKRKSCRYAIQRAERDSVKIKVNHNYDDFYKIYKLFIKYNKNIAMPENIATIKRYGTLFTAEYDGEILGGHVYLEDENTIMYWISATKRQDVDRDRKIMIGNASHLIHWEAIKYAKRKGIKEFDMGGLFAGEGNDYQGHSIDVFKEHFGGIRAIRYLYYKNYSTVYRIGVNLYEWLKSS